MSPPKTPVRDEAAIRRGENGIETHMKGLESDVAFLAVVAIPRINNLRAINTLDGSALVASTNISFIISYLQTHFNCVQ